MSLIKKLLTIFIIITANAATDRELLITHEAKFGTSSSFRDNLDELQKDTNYYNKGRKIMKGFIYVGRESTGFLLDMPVVENISGPVKRVVNWTADLGNLLVDSAMDYQIQEAARGAIYTAWKTDRTRVEIAFSIEDETKKAVEVYKILNDMDAFGEKLGADNLGTDERAILNSRMILRLSEVTKNISKSTLQNSAEIKKLRASHENFQKFLNNEYPKFKEFLRLQKERKQLYEEVYNSSTQAARGIAAVIEKNAPEDIRSGNISEADKKDLAENMADLAETMQKAEAYLAKTSQIANNLLKGKDLERVNKAIFYASNGFKVVGGIARASNGDPMGAMDALVGVSNLFGRQKPNPESERHIAIMKAFGQVLANQKKIIENQRKMYELQIHTYKLLASLHKVTVSNFENLNDRIDVILGNQAALLSNVINFAEVKENLDSCKEFLNSRFKCRPEFLEAYGDKLKCISQISKQKPIGDFRDNFTPDEQPSSTSLIQGKFTSYESMFQHFYLGQNRSLFKNCYEGFKVALGHDLHPLFLSKSYPKPGSFTSYNDDFIIPVFKPLFELSEKYYMSNERAANAFYKSLLLAHKDVSSLSQKVQRIKAYINELEDWDLLSYDQIKIGLSSHIYTSALDQYLSSFTEVAMYWDLIQGSIESDFSLVPVESLSEHGASETSSELKKYFSKLVNITELSIAQQNLLSGDVMLPLLRNILKRGSSHKDYELAVKALRNNPYLFSNLVVYSMTNAFDAKENSKSFYESYYDYLDNGLGDCKFDGNRYGKDCSLLFLNSTNLPFVFHGDKISIKNKNDTSISNLTAKQVNSKLMIYSPYFYRTLKLRNHLYSTIARYQGAMSYVLDSTYVLN